MANYSMKQGRRRKTIVLSIIFLFLISALFYVVVYLQFKKTYLDPYEQFREMQFQALPQFDKLNEQNYQELPEPPAGFEFLKKTSEGIEYQWHIGRWMTVSLQGQESAADEFFDYYETYLLSKNWSLLREDEFEHRSDTYYRGTSCIRLLKNEYGYFIHIWQDFEHQPFIGEIPSDNVIGLHLYEPWIIATCP